MSRTQPVIATAREDVPVLREAMGELTTNPRGALAKISAVLKDIWAKIQETGLLTAVFSYLQGMLTSLTNSASSASTTTTSTSAQQQLPDANSSLEQNETLSQDTTLPLVQGEKEPLV